MYKRLLPTVFITLLFLFVPLSKTYAQDNETTAQTVIHLLSYVAMDYSGAVQNGEIISQSEYQEQIEFAQQALELAKTGSFLTAAQKDSILPELHRLIKRVDEKQSTANVSAIAKTINSTIIAVTGIQTAPKVWPNLAKGKALFKQSCAACHGKNGAGNGPLAANLTPRPTNFLNDSHMKNVSPYLAYNTIRLGVTGTGMRPFTEFNDVQLWNLAFYVKSLRFENATNDSLALREVFDRNFSKIELGTIATHTDTELIGSLTASGVENPEQLLTAIRTLEPTADQAINSLVVAREKLDAALKSYRSGHTTLARTQALSAYLEGIEPVEARLKTINSDLVVAIEKQMFSVRQAIEKGKESQVLKAEINQAHSLIDQADQLMENNQLNYWLTFLIAASIMLREGLEAFLILAVVLALIRNSGVRKALPWLHGGWITAVVMGVVGWFLSDYIIQFGGRNREIMEGLVALFAVLVLLSVGFWLHDKSYAKQWKEFIENKIGRYLKKDKMFGLAAFAFMVVFREAFEVILFLQAISLEASPENQSAIGFGVIAAVICIAIMAYLVLKYSKRLPIRQLFRYSSWFIILLAIILMGKGIHALQESGWVSVTNLSSALRIEWLGLYPTLETLLWQLALIGLIVILYLFNKQKRKKAEVTA